MHQKKIQVPSTLGMKYSIWFRRSVPSYEDIFMGFDFPWVPDLVIVSDGFLVEPKTYRNSQANCLFLTCRLLQAEGSAKDDTQTSMQHENASLRATISRQSQKIGRMENDIRKNELVLKDQGELQSTVDKQREKIVKYQREIEETKLHMARLEDLVHQVQEQSMKEPVTATPSVSIKYHFKL